jgi:phosphoglycerate dehydrogenase-like enzyme
MKIVVDAPVHPPGLEHFRKIGCEVCCIDPPGEIIRDLDPALIEDADILLTTFPPSNFELMKSLRWIQLISTGYNQLYPLGLTAKGIKASNSQGVFNVPIAEWNIAMMINLARNVRQMIRHQDAGIWDRSAVFQREIRGLTVGLWGYGGIGRETARLAKQLGLTVHAYTRSGIKPRTNIYLVPGTGDPEGVLPDRAFTAGQEKEFLGGLDFLVLSLPLTPATRGLIGEKELRALRPGAFLLNPARGPIVQEEALHRALTEGWIAGAALDTQHKNPCPPEDPIWRFPNAIVTPHISGSSLGPHFNERMWDIFRQNYERFTSGRPLLNELSAVQLSGA